LYKAGEFKRLFPACKPLIDLSQPIGTSLALGADKVKRNEKSRENDAEENYEERSQIHQVKVTIAGARN
jgi:hypothetical protein